jgi:hypothetical protein
MHPFEAQQPSLLPAVAAPSFQPSASPTYPFEGRASDWPKAKARRTKTTTA